MFIVYGKESCTYCTQATNLLKAKGLEFAYKILGEDYTKEGLIESLSVFGVLPRTMPQIVLVSGEEKEYIGGFTELQRHISFGELNERL